MQLGDFTDIKSQNLNILKFFAACAVIASHSYPLSQGSKCKDFLIYVSKGSLGLGGLAVAVFFISSGYLVSKSIEKKNNTYDYLKARIMRIIPPLAFTVIITILVCGLFFSTFAFVDYLFNVKILKYCLNIFLIPVHELPGVFESNIYGNVVNGALWTLPIEFVCYVLLLVVYKMNLLNKKSYTILTPLVIISFVCINIINVPLFQVIKPYIQPIYIFYAGTFYYVYRDKIKINKNNFIISILIFVVLLFASLGNVATIFVFPYIILSFCFKQCSEKIARVGNISYGMYLCGFPIQQMIVSSFGGSMNIYLNMVISIVLSIIVGYCIYYVAE